MDQKPFIVKSHDIHIDSGYREWLQDLKRRYQSAQIKASVKVNSEQLLFNWQLGRDLVVYKAEEKWGKGVVEQLSLDLQDTFPGVVGFSARNLWFMKQWYLFYSSQQEAQTLIDSLTLKINEENQKLKQVASDISTPKLKQAVSEMPFPAPFSYVPWGHHVKIIQKCQSVEEALFYIERTIENGWSRKALEDNLDADLYHKKGAAITNYTERLPLPQGRLALELTKENYDLGFISLPGTRAKRLSAA